MCNIGITFFFTIVSNIIVNADDQNVRILSTNFTQSNDIIKIFYEMLKTMLIYKWI